MDNSRERRTEGARTIPGWKALLRDTGHFIAAGALLLGGVVFTLQQHPVLHAPVPGIRLPAAVVEAPSFAEEAMRVAAVLRQYTKDDEAADRIAGAIVDEGTRRDLDPALLVGVLLTEDATLDTTARSSMGARGLMQVMPTHAGQWGCGSRNLFSIESNICHGASILQDNIKNSPSTRVALLRYNGCVRGTNTPDCHTYPDKVMRAAHRTSRELLAMSASNSGDGRPGA